MEKERIERLTVEPLFAMKGKERKGKAVQIQLN